MPIDQTLIKRLIYLDTDGIQARTRSGDITNIGGTSSSTFTVGGKALLFADGTSTNGEPISNAAITLQSVYNSSTDSNGAASIKLNTGKDLVIYDDTDNNVFFKIDSTTGKVTITGDLTVLGSASIIESQTQAADHWAITPNSTNYIALSIEPDSGITPIQDLINVKNIFGGTSVFRVDASGKTITKNLQVNGNIVISGTINGVDIVELNNEVYDHLTSPSFPKHHASQIEVAPSVSIAPNATNVQQVLEAFNSQIVQFLQGSTIGIEFIQPTPEIIWTITHGRNTKKIQWSLYNELDEWILPDSFKIIDENTVEFSLGSPMAGRAILITF